MAMRISYDYIHLLLAALLLLSLAPLSNGYYQLVRILAVIGFAMLAYIYYLRKAVPLAITFCGLALLFQPFIKVVLGRTLWNVVDVIVAVGLIALWIKDSQQK